MASALIAAPVLAGGAVEIPLRYIGADTAYAVIKDTPGLDSMTVHLKTNTLSFSGTDEGIAAAKSFLALMDVPPGQATLSLRLVAYDRDAAGHIRETPMQTSVLTTADNRPASVDVDAGGTRYRVEITPRMWRDGSLTLVTGLEEIGPKGAARRSSQTVRRIRQDTPGRLAGLTASNDMLLRHAVEAGEVVPDRGPYTAVYLEISAHNIAAQAAK